MTEIENLWFKRYQRVGYAFKTNNEAGLNLWLDDIKTEIDKLQIQNEGLVLDRALKIQKLEAIREIVTKYQKQETAWSYHPVYEILEVLGE